MACAGVLYDSIGKHFSTTFMFLFFAACMLAMACVFTVVASRFKPYANVGGAGGEEGDMGVEGGAALLGEGVPIDEGLVASM